MAARLFSRLPPRILVPFLLFWSLGSVVLGHELASLPLASFASAVTRPLQLPLQVQGAFPRAETHPRPASPVQVATGGLGNKLPAVVIHKGARAKHRVRTPHRNIARTAAVSLSNGTGQDGMASRAGFSDWQSGAFAYGFADSAPPWPGFSPQGWYGNPSGVRWAGDWRSPCDWAPRASYAWP